MRLLIARAIIATVSVVAFTAFNASTPAESSIVARGYTSFVSPLLHNRYSRFVGSGGALVFATCKFKINHQPVDLAPSVQFASNSLGRKHQVVDIQDGQAPLPGAPVPNGYTLDWAGFLATADMPITFSTANLDFAIAGTALNPNTSYYLYVYTNFCGEQCGSWTLLSSAPLGMPMSGSLIGPSPLENGLVFGSQANAMALVLVH